MINVLPINDLRDHEEATSCWCHPRLILDAPEIIAVHHSADGRELLEANHKEV